MRHFPLRECGYTIGFLVLLAAPYIGTYFALVIRLPNVLYPGTMRPGMYLRAYRVDEEWVAVFFEPIHSADRECLRPSYWTVRER